MVVIQHKPIPQITHRYYRAECSCGCMFEFIDTEANYQRRLDFQGFITCPDCHKQIILDDACISQISGEQYEADRMKYDE